jgi:septum formation protein
MLSQFVDARHDVVTGVAIIDAAGDRVDVFHDRTAVTIGKVPHRELEEYLNSGGWVGKAGGYNLAELERLWPFEIEGDPTTVIGLPIETLSSRLRRFAGRGGG